MKTDNISALIELKSCYKAYKKQGKLSLVLKDISLTFKSGSFIAILGSSGSGKTTLLKLISGLINPSKGEIFFNDKKISDKSFSELSAMRRQYYGFMFQDTDLINYLTVSENISFPNINENNRRLDDLIKMLGLTENKTELPDNISQGEKQRTMFARAIFNDPDVILVDEPTANLDWENAKILFDHLFNLSKLGKLVIVATHDERVADYSTKLFRLLDGRIISK